MLHANAQPESSCAVFSFQTNAEGVAEGIVEYKDLPIVPQNFHPEFYDYNLVKDIRNKYCCVIPKCPSKFWHNIKYMGYRNKNFHKFPVDPTRRRKWIETVKQETGLELEFNQAINRRICEDHFPAKVKTFSNRVWGDPSLFCLELNEQPVQQQVFNVNHLKTVVLAEHDYTILDQEVEFHKEEEEVNDILVEEPVNSPVNVYDRYNTLKKKKYCKRKKWLHSILKKSIGEEKYKKLRLSYVSKDCIRYKFGKDRPNFRFLSKTQLCHLKKTKKSLVNLKNSIILPYGSTLKALLHNLPLESGINDWVFTRFSWKVKTMKKKEKYCMLMFGKCTLSGQLHYSHRKDTILKPYKFALIFMIQGINNSWKQPIAFYFIEDPDNVKIMQQALDEVLCKLQDMGLLVFATLCDHSKPNRRLLKQMSTKNNPYFYFQKRKIFTFFDPSQLLVSTKNTLQNYNIKFGPGKGAKYQHLIQTFKRDSQVPYPMLSKIGGKYLYSNKNDYFKTSEIFSYSMASCMVKDLGEQGYSTADFVLNMIELKNVFSKKSKLHCRKIRKKVEQWKFQAKDIIKNDLPIKRAWIKTLRATEEFDKNLCNLDLNSLKDFLLNTQIFGKNHISKLTPVDFVFGYKVALLNTSSFLDNYRDLLKCSIKKPKSNVNFKGCGEIKDNLMSDFQLDSSEQFEMITQVFRILLKSFNIYYCFKCNQNIFDTTNLTDVNALRNIHLNHFSLNLIQYLSQIYHIMRHMLQKVGHINDIRKKLKNYLLENVSFSWFKCNKHRTAIQNNLLQISVLLGIKHRCGSLDVKKIY